jgi:hypothetical protein
VIEERVVFLRRKDNPIRAYKRTEWTPPQNDIPGCTIFEGVILTRRDHDGYYEVPGEQTQYQGIQRVSIKQWELGAAEEHRSTMYDPYYEISCMQNIGDNIHVLNILEALRTETHLYIITPWPEGLTLAEKIPLRPLEDLSAEDQARAVFRQILENLQYMHQSRRTFHHNIQPGNCLVNGYDRVVLSGMVQENDVFKKEMPFLKSPEDLDLWMSTVILFELVFGSKPYELPNTNDVMFRFLFVARVLSRSPNHDLEKEILHSMSSSERYRLLNLKGKISSISDDLLELFEHCFALEPTKRWSREGMMQSNFMRKIPTGSNKSPVRIMRDRLVVIQSTPLVHKSISTQQVFNMPSLDVQEEQQVLREALHCPHERACKIDIVFEGGGKDRLDYHLEHKTGRMIHIRCHGGETYMGWENERGELTQFSYERNLEIPPEKRPLCVFVASTFAASIGHQFLRAGVPHVVCCDIDNDCIVDEVALRFTKTFYTCLARQENLLRAFQMACNDVRSSPEFDPMDVEEKFTLLPSSTSNTHHEIPVFFTSPVPAVEISRRRDPVMFGIPESNSSMVGRGIEQYQVLDAFERTPIVRLQGHDGVGITSVAAAVCRHMLDRPYIYQLDYVLWIPNDLQVQNEIRIVVLLSTYVRLMMMDNVVRTKAKIEECKALLTLIAEELSGKNSLLVWDMRTYQSGSGERNLQNLHLVEQSLLSLSTSASLKFILISRDVPSSVSAPEEEKIRISPLDRPATIELFARQLSSPLRTYLFKTNPRLNFYHDLVLYLCNKPKYLNASAHRRTLDNVFHDLGSGYPRTCVVVAKACTAKRAVQLMTTWGDNEGLDPDFLRLQRQRGNDVEGGSLHRQDFLSPLQELVGQERYRKSQAGRTLVHSNLPQPEDDTNLNMLLSSTSPLQFVVCADTQFGMTNSNAEWEIEKDYSRKAVAFINELEPRPLFCCVCGDLVDMEYSFYNGKDDHTFTKEDCERIQQQQRAEFQEIWSKLNDNIALICVCGNHDIGNRPTKTSIDSFIQYFGDDYFAFWSTRQSYNIVLNTTLFSDPSGAPDLHTLQLGWLKERLQYAKSNKATSIFVFGHHPWFLYDEKEEEKSLHSYSIYKGRKIQDSYFPIPKTNRMEVMKLFEDYGVSAAFAGHFHQNLVSEASFGMKMIVTSSLSVVMEQTTGLPDTFTEPNTRGMRIVQVQHDGTVQHQFVSLPE